MYTDADGRTYVYVYRNRWDPEKKQSRIEKRCHVGRLDPQTGQVHIGCKFLTNNPEYAGKFWLYDNNQLIEQEPFEQPDTDNEPQPSWRGEDVGLGQPGNSLWTMACSRTYRRLLAKIRVRNCSALPSIASAGKTAA